MVVLALMVLLKLPRKSIGSSNPYRFVIRAVLRLFNQDYHNLVLSFHIPLMEIDDF